MSLPPQPLPHPQPVPHPQPIAHPQHGRGAELEPISPLGRGTLGRRLAVHVTVLVALTAILLSTLTVLSTSQLMTRSLDRQLDAATSRQVERGPRDKWGGDRGGPPTAVMGQPVGTIVVRMNTSTGFGTGSVVSDDADGQRTLSAEAIARLLQVEPDRGSETVDVPGFGDYRVKAVERPDGVQIVALPLRDMKHTLAEMVGMAVLLTLLGIALAVFAVRRLVVSALAPLNRLAGTAQQVSQLDLDRGEVALPVRVAPQDADPRTEVGQVGSALNHLLNNVEGALSARWASESKVRQFVADASHELRNPLAAIRGYAELTRRDRDQLPPDTAFAMSRVESEAERMSGLVEDMLLLARMDSKPDLQLTRVDLRDLVLNAVSDAQAADAAYDWGVDLPEVEVYAHADPHRLHQVVANLLANARKHTPEGTEVTVAVRRDGDRAVITVTDDGPGIAPEIQPTVFQRFVRADSARTRSGVSKDSTGLGLAIVQSVMEAHGGTAEVTSRPGFTEFTLRLPAA
ncbi:HAMP domain-containing sensor histidine kinase [Mariniluteicoccus endophyticus]